HVLQVEFSKPVFDFEKHDVTLQEKASLSRVGIDRIEIASNGLSAEIITYDNTSEDAPDEVKRGVEYTLQIKDLTFDFSRPFYADSDDDSRVVEVDEEKRTIKL